MVIRLMTPGDLVEVFELDKKEPSSWSMQQFEDELRNVNGLHIIAKDSDEVLIAFACSRVIDEEAELFKLTVSDSCRRQGVGYALLNFLLTQFNEMGVKNCYLELREHNSAALMLYEKCGFAQVGKRENYFRCPKEDALLMKKEMKKE